MKEKIGIEKLIELLNEYLSPFSGYIQYHNGNGFKRTPTKSAVEGDRMLQDEYVLGKSFGFIKWLVENDKIDREKFGNSETKSSKYSDYELSYDNSREDYTNILLMELAIQDEPIQFLIGILR